MKDSKDTLVLLELPPQKQSVFLVLHRPSYNQSDDGLKFFFEEHSCPTNWINDIVMVASDADLDPHGLFRFVRSAPAPDGIGEGAFEGPEEDEVISGIFPEVLGDKA